MSAPELPEIFGNYTLGDSFVEVVSPAGISWLPQTTGWLLVGAALAALLCVRTWHWVRRWYRDRYRREALASLAELDTIPPGDDWLTELNALLKRTALAGYGRTRVAALSGQQWIQFLNSQCAEPLFTDRAGELLAQGVYRAGHTSGSERQILTEAAKQWISSHTGETDV